MCHMKSLRNANLVLLAGTAGLAISASSAAAQATFTGLGDLPGGNTFSIAAGVSADGTAVVGSSVSTASNPDREAFRWTASGGMVALGDLPGRAYASYGDAISDDGTTVSGGSISSVAAATSFEGYYWTQSSGMVGIGVPVGDSRAKGISGDGNTLVGDAGFTGPSREGYFWTSGAGFTSIGKLAQDDSTYALCASYDGSIIYGYSILSAGGNRARMWDSTNGLTEPYTGDGVIRATNNAGDICTGNYGQSPTTMLRYTSSGGATSLPDASGTNNGRGYALSDDGNVIVGDGRIIGSSNRVATIWINGYGTFVLQDWLNDNFGLNISSWTLVSCAGISEDGLTIVGTGTNASSQTEAWHLTLPWLHCPADWNKDGVLDSQDQADFDTDYNSGDADYNGDGTTNSLDYIAFLNGLSAGC